MSSLTIASIVFAGMFGGAMLAMFLRARLPGHHVKQESKDVAK